MSVCLNLIPDYRQEVGARRKWIRCWVIGGSAFGLVLLVSCLLLRVVFGQANPSVDSAMSQEQAQVDTVNAAISAIRSELNQHETTLRANRDLIEHPDWGLLLGLLAKSLSDELVLRDCQISQQRQRQPSRGQSVGDYVLANADETVLGGRHYRLAIRGMGRSQAAVSQFALRLEQTALFNGVKLVDTSLEPYLAGKAVSFRLECRLDAGGGDRP